MIEYKLSWWKDTWYELTEKGFVPREDDFTRLKFRVGGVEFEEWSTEFEQAWMMEKLKK